MSDQTNERIAFFVFFGVSVSLFVIQLLKHLHNFHAPFLQRYFIRLLFLPVFYTFCAFINFINPDAANITDIVTSYYESYCLALFFNIMISATGGIEMAAKVISGQIIVNSGSSRSNSEASMQNVKVDKDHRIIVNGNTESQHSVNAVEENNSSKGEPHTDGIVSYQSDEHSSDSRLATVSPKKSGRDSPMLLNLHWRAVGNSEVDNSATNSALKNLRLNRILCYQVVMIKPFMSALNAVIVSVDGEGSIFLWFPKVVGIVTVTIALYALYNLYKLLKPSKLLKKISPVKKLVWMKKQIALEMAAAFILSTIGNSTTLPGPDDYDRYERTTRILAIFLLFEAHFFLILAFWLLPADDPAIVEWENVMHINSNQDNKCAFCLKSILFCDLGAIHLPNLQQPLPPTLQHIQSNEN